MKKVCLFCLPCAGSSAVSYMKWARFLDKNINLIPLELPGRGRRYSAPLCKSIDELVEDVYEQMRNTIDEMPYAIFGHSMGSIIAFELYYKIIENNHSKPLHIFFSGREAPHIRKTDIVYHLLPDKELTAEVAKMGGTPVDLLDNEQFVSTYMPIIRADLRINETYGFKQRLSKVDCGATILTGKEDERITFNDIIGWREHISTRCNIYNMEGGHFFIFDKMEDVTGVINKVISYAFV